MPDPARPLLACPPLTCEAPFWARGAHLQTIAAQYLPTPAPALPWERRTLALGDGDQLAVRWLAGTTGVAIVLFHGLGGSVDGHYMRRMAARFHARGHALLMVNHRGAGEGQGLARKPYHSGSTGDLGAALALGRELFPGQLQMALGFSISANMLLLLLGRDAALGVPDRAIAVNPPVDLEACSLRLSRGFNRFYDQYFVRRIRREVQARPSETALPRTGTLRALDQIYTAPRAGFPSRLAYYNQCSSGPHLKNIEVPTVIISSMDDPFAPAGDILKQALGPRVHLHTEATGGHMGYVARNLPDHRWLDYALDHYVHALEELKPEGLAIDG
jgi:predicted alpha/beta-fold hydrolase